MNLETIGFYVLLFGMLLSFVGWIWLTVRAFRQRILWGVAVLLVPPLFGLIFTIVHWKRARGPVFVVLLAAVISATPFAFVRYFFNLGPREKIVDNELNITLTGWDQTNYGLLRFKPATVVLQMANADVDDHTLDDLKNMPELRELDLNDTQITDAGLSTLNAIPKLATLRMARTQITDEGFKKHLFDKESLNEIDVRGTKVTGKTVREWKKAKEGRKALQ